MDQRDNDDSENLFSLPKIVCHHHGKTVEEQLQNIEKMFKITHVPFLLN